MEFRAYSHYLPKLHETSRHHILDPPITIQFLADYSQGLSPRHNRELLSNLVFEFDANDGFGEGLKAT